MKGGSIFGWRTVVGVVESTSPGAALRRSASFDFWESRVEWPCSVGIRSERVEAAGAAGRTTWIAVVGWADETSARSRLCGVSLVRSSRRQPLTTACPGGDALPQGGGAAPNCCVAQRRSENLGACQLWKENHRGVKIIRAQDYGSSNFLVKPVANSLGTLSTLFEAVEAEIRQRVKAVVAREESLLCHTFAV
jgi:hypothetical protein